MRGFGYIPDTPDERDKLLSAHSVYGLPTVEFANVDVVSIGPKFQAGSQSCVGQGISSGLRLAYIHTGIVCPELSALACYRGARNIDGNAGDVGTMIRSGMRAVMEVGIPTEEFWPFSMERVNTQLPFKGIHAGFDRYGIRAYRRVAPGDLDGMARSLSVGWPLAAGWKVTGGFVGGSGLDIVDAQRDPFVGGHAMDVVTVGSRDRMIAEFGDNIPPTNEKRLWRILTSWGPWGFRGRFYATDAFVEGATDIWSMDVTSEAA